MMDRWGYGWGMDGGGWISLIVMAVIGLVILAGLIALLVWAVRAASGGGHHRYATHGGYGGRGPEHMDRDERMRYEGGGGTDFVGPGTGGGGAPGRADDAVEIARRRFAAGEITREQYDELLNALKR